MDKHQIDRVLRYIYSRSQPPSLRDCGLSVDQARELLRRGLILATCDDGTWFLRVSTAGANLIGGRFAA